MGSIDLNAALTAGSSLAAGLSARYVLSGHPAAGALVTPSPRVAYTVASLPVGSASVGGSLTYRLSASLVGDSSFQATRLSEDILAAVLGSSSISPQASVHWLVTGSGYASAHVGANLQEALALTAAPVGGSHLSAYWGQFLSGTASGHGDITGGIQLAQLLSGTAHGNGSLSAPLLLQTIIFSGTASGVGTLVDNSLFALSGTASGVGTLNAPRLNAELLASGFASGFATLYDAGPLPIVGVGMLYGFLDKETIAPPINCPPPHPDPECDDDDDRFHPRPPGGPRPRFDRLGFQHPFPEPDQDLRRRAPPCPRQFRLGYIFTMGDLQLTLTNSGNLTSPVTVLYTMFQVTSTGSLMQAGPTKKAVKQSNGIFYAVGTAGEGGQPGNWLVRWAYQQTFGGDYTTIDQPFQVVDAISAPIIWDPTCRKTKYGWD
jgi:hypothetical protein